MVFSSVDGETMSVINLSSNMVNKEGLVKSQTMRDREVRDRHDAATELRALKRACKDFESIFMYTLLKTMRRSIPKSASSGTDAQMYTSIGDLELARFVAHGQGTGLGEMLFEHLREKVV
jgi:flagellar protein FlgJ